MKNIKFILLSIVLLVNLACKKDFLDKAPSIDVTENTVFSSKQQFEQFMATIYEYGMHSVLRYDDASVSLSGVIHPTSDISDEGDASEAIFPNTNVWNAGGVLPSTIVSNEDFRYYQRWIAIRQINLVIKRAGEVAALSPGDTALANFISRSIAEVKVLRAMNYFEMIKRYGGVPILDKVYKPSDDAIIPRSSLDSCLKFVLKDCDDAIATPSLPANYSASEKGRVSKMVALALKSKALLFAASPQFNTAIPYLSMPNAADNRFVCLGNYDVNRWALAAAAAKDALKYAADNGYALIDDPTKRDPAVPAVGTGAPIGNYRNAWEQFDNPELILTYQGGNSGFITTAPLKYIVPTGLGATWCGITLTLNFLKKYEKKTDGLPQTWDNGGTDLLAKLNLLDPRFKQSILYTTSYFNPSFPVAEIYEGARPYLYCKGGMWIRKLIPGTTSRTNVNDVLFRVNELYLNLAEAANEAASGVVPQEAYDAVNTIRTRSGMPNLSGLTQDQFRQRVRNEWAVELFFEDHRFWDVKRWMIADTDGIMKGNMDGLKITKNGNLYAWQPYTFETRIFDRKAYLHPFPEQEVLKGTLLQNPGW